MIRRLEIRNFKSHKDTRIDANNLTVLTGVNSAGKSSLVQALLLLRQSFFKGRLESGLELNGPLCRIGTGQDALCRFANEGEMEFCIRDDVAELRFDYGVDLNSVFADATDMHCRLQNGDEVGADMVRSGVLSKLSLFNSDFQYVSALRWGGKSHFDRFDYEVEKRRQLSVELGQGEAVAHYLYKFGGEDTYDYIDDAEPTSDRKLALSDQVELWERRISRDVTVSVQKGASDGFDILYGHKFSSTKVIDGLGAANVGYGISHVLPVLTALLTAKPNALVVLENPEAHLHPKGQSELARLIARVAQAGAQVIVETHSDHIINGVLVATKMFEEGRRGLDRSNVAIYSFDKDPDTQTFTVPREVKIVANGRLDSQPEGFFDQAEKDLFIIDGV